MEKKSFNIAHILPYLAGIVIFYIATFIFFQPELLNGRSLRQGDVMQYEGMSRKPIEYREKTGEQALWNDGMFAGMPDYLVSTGVPHHPLPFLFQITRGFLDKDAAAHLFFMTMLCSFLALLCFRIHPYLAIFGALAFGLNTYNILNIEAGHVTKVWAIAYAPLVLGGMHLVFRGKMWLGAAIFIISFALHLRVPHYQITYYLAFICAIYAISELVFAVRQGKIIPFAKQASLLLLGVGIGAMVVLGRFFMVQEYEKYSIRGQSELTDADGTKPENRGSGLDKEYAFAWSQGKMETLTMLIPYFYGGASNETLDKESTSYKTLQRLMEPQRFQQMANAEGIPLPTYRGDQPFTGGPLYAGAIVCFLFIFSLFVLDNNMRWWILGGFLVAMMISWGRNFEVFNYFLFDYFPSFNKFRTVMMALSMAMMLMPIASMLAVQKVIEEGWNDELKKKLYFALGITGGLTLLVAVFGGIFDYSAPSDSQYPKQLVTALEADRLSLARSDAFRSFILIALCAGALWLGITKKLSFLYTTLIIGVLLVFDLWVVDRRYLKDDNFQRNVMSQMTVPSPADQEILKDPDPHYRVFNIASNTLYEARTSYFHKSLGGYFAAKLRRYQDLFERHLSGEMQVIATALQNNRQDLLSKAQVTNMLNAKYFLIGGQAVENTAVLGDAWFVENVKTVASPDEEIQQLGEINTSNEVVLDTEKFTISKTQFTKGENANITLESYSPKKIVYNTSNANAGLAVFSEIYYPEGWIATIDGEPTNIIRVNYVLRALEIPAGEHKVVFSFEPESYKKGAIISQTGSIAATLLFVVFIAMHFISNRKKE